jgi:hypothetical protein
MLWCRNFLLFNYQYFKNKIMYYKIVNKDSEVYKRLHEMRTKELQMEADNKQTINDITGLAWTKFLGHHGQQTFCRVTSYSGFEFTEPEKVNLKIWSKHKQFPGIYFPNKRTELGRKMSKILTNGLKGSSISVAFENLGIEFPHGNFSFPFVEIINDIILVYLGENQIPTDENIVEITSKEFDLLRG